MTSQPERGEGPKEDGHRIYLKQQAKKGGSKEGGKVGLCMPWGEGVAPVRCALNLVDFSIPSALPPLSLLS
jgi:hypothetical protein